MNFLHEAFDIVSEAMWQGIGDPFQMKLKLFSYPRLWFIWTNQNDSLVHFLLIEEAQNYHILDQGSIGTNKNEKT